MPVVAKPIRRPAFFLVAAAACVILVVAIMAWRSSTDKPYLVNQVLLSPEAISSTHYYDIPPAADRGPGPYIFNQVEFEVLDSQGGHWLRHPVSLDRYAQFYATVADKKSVAPLPEGVAEEFDKRLLGRLIITLRSQASSAGAGAEDQERGVVIFQEVYFAAGLDFFRVRLQEDSSDSLTWVYFESPNLAPVITYLLPQ